MTDEDFLKALAPEVNQDRALLEALAIYREAVALRMEVNILKGSGNIQPMGFYSRTMAFDPAVGRDKSVFYDVENRQNNPLEKMGYLSENGEGE